MPSANLATLRARVSTLIVACALSLLVVAALNAARASATSTYAYEEGARFGGFDTSAYNGGHYGGTLTPGKFVDPTGFAVDTHDATAPSDDTALYVVDRTSGLAGAHTSWRLQKLGAAGQVIASTTFQLPNEPFSAQTGISGLAVDDSGGGGRVYALVVGNDSSITSFAYAKEIVAWSTAPNGSKELVAPSGLGADPLGSTGGLVSSEAQLASKLNSEEALYDPQGIAVDVDGGEHDLAIEASDDTGTGSSGITSIPGVAGVWQVATAAQGSHHTGELLGSWSARTLAAAAPAGEDEAAPYGISTNADGSLSVLLAEASGVGNSSDIDAVKLSSALGGPQMQLDAADSPADQDRSASYLSSPPGPYGGGYVAQSAWAGPGLVQLSSGLYAADIEHQAKTTDPYATNGSDYYWRSAETTTSGVANVGVRLLLPNHGGEVSDAKGDTIVNTLGYAKIVSNVAQAGGVCNLDAESESLAAGANGTLWVLGRGLDSSSGGAASMLGREIVELTPGGSGAKACPQPSGAFMASATEVSAGSTVEFNADDVNLQSGSPFAYEWELDNAGFTLVNEIGKWLNSDGVEVLSWPPSTASFTYTKPGVYTVKLRVRSDYGTYEAPSQTITVTNAQLPVAKFTVAANPLAGHAVSFDASESSTPTSGATIVNYHWIWGDGSEEDQQSTSASHTYGSAGSYTAKLIVTDSNGLKSEAFSEKIVVGTETTGGGGGGGGGATTATTTTPTKTPPPLETGPPSVSPKAIAAAGGIVSTTVSCPTTSQSCAGTIQVKTASAVAASAAKKGKKKPKKTQLVLGSASFTLAAGGSQTLTIHISSKGMALLNKSKTLRVLVIVSAHGAAGSVKTETLTLALHAAKKGKKKH